MYATPHLTVRQPTPVRFLNEIGLGATAISIKYPVWVTEEDFDACARTFSVELGNTPYPANTSGAVFGFDFGSSPISLRASDCHAPPSQTISSSNSTVDYYLRLHDQSPLVSYETILVTPTVRLTSTVQSKALDNLSFQMRFEHPIWSQVRQIGLALTGASAGSMIFLFLIQIGYKKLTARNS